MSKDWTPGELTAASEAMKAAGHMSYDEFCKELNEQLAKQMLENFGKIQSQHPYPCPRCGRDTMDDSPARNALSRRANVQICDACGMQEALEDMMDGRTPLTDWAYIKMKEAVNNG